jgi:hypothetical protein
VRCPTFFGSESITAELMQENSRMTERMMRMTKRMTPWRPKLMTPMQQQNFKSLEELKQEKKAQNAELLKKLERKQNLELLKKQKVSYECDGMKHSMEIRFYKKKDQETQKMYAKIVVDKNFPQNMRPNLVKTIENVELESSDGKCKFRFRFLRELLLQTGANCVQSVIEYEVVVQETEYIPSPLRQCHTAESEYESEVNLNYDSEPKCEVDPNHNSESEYEIDSDSEWSWI